MTCPARFHLCSLAAESGLYGVFDCVTETSVECSDEADARKIASSLYPNAIFALTTLATVYEKLATVEKPDMVVMAVLIPDGPDTHKLVAHVHGNVYGSTCIPFTSDVWPDARSHMPSGKN